MVIRCPYCEFARSINSDKIPATAESATCPKCKQRFRFRIIEDSLDNPEQIPSTPTPPPSTPHADVWDAVDSLNSYWSNRVDGQIPEEATTPQQNLHNTQAWQNPSPHAQMIHEQYEQHGEVHASKHMHTSPDANFDNRMNSNVAYTTTSAVPQQISQSAQHTATGNATQPSKQIIPPQQYTPEGLPIRDLGLIEEASLEKDDLPEIRKIHWEHPASNGWFFGLINTIRSVLTSAPAFFRTFPADGSNAFAFLFFLLHGYIAILFGFLWLFVASTYLGTQYDTFFDSSFALYLLLIPVFLGILLVLLASIIRILLEAFCKERILFTRPYRLICYASAPLIISIIPFFGFFAGCIWFLLTLTTGVKYNTSLSWGKSFVCTLPAYLLAIAGFFIFL